MFSRTATTRDPSAPAPSPRRAIRRWAVWAVALPLAAAAWSCDRGTTAKDDASPRGPAPDPEMVAALPPLPATRPTTVPAAVAKAGSVLSFQFPDTGGEPVDPTGGAWIVRQFPAARLRLADNGDGRVSAMLFSDDPKEAINSNWAGDRYYFEMRVRANGVQNLDGAQWWHQHSPSEQEDASDGVFLKGDRYHLEPLNVVVQFDGRPGKDLRVRISGQFLQHDTTDPTVKPRLVMVQGLLEPKVETKN